MLLLTITHAMAMPLASPGAPGAGAPGAGALGQITPILSVHARQAAELGAQQRRGGVPSRSVLPRVGPPPDLTVYGYLAYWNDDLSSVQWGDITHLALFSANATSTGGLTDTQNWSDAASAVAMAAPYGVRVHLCVTNFDSASLETLLGSTTYRDTLIAGIAAQLEATGAHGVNIDFENLPASRRAQMVDFVAALEAEVGEVVLATPSVDWSGAWDYAQLTQHADLFIMGYGYHWSGSSYAGPTDPLNAGAGTVWSGINSYSLSRTVDDYLSAGADPDRVILGLPLYGRRWPVSSNTVPTSALATGTTVLFSDAVDEIAQHGRFFEADASAPYTYDGVDQIWAGDTDSVRQRISYVRDDTSLAGIGFWALHYTDAPDFWQMVHDETHRAAPGSSDTSASDTSASDTGASDTGTDATSTTADGELVADAGAPFLAYVGDTVILSAEGSRGPDGVELQYRWSQREGPPVVLTNDRSANPTFQIRSIGNLVFEVEVGDGSDWSDPASSYVVVIDPGIARRRSGSCGVVGASGMGWLSLLILLGHRRRAQAGLRVPTGPLL